VHWFKTTNRPAITVRTKGIGNPFISMIEDGLVILVAVLAIFVPWGMIVVLPVAGFYLVRAYRRMRTGQTRIMALLGMQQTK